MTTKKNTSSITLWIIGIVLVLLIGGGIWWGYTSDSFSNLSLFSSSKTMKNTVASGDLITVDYVGKHLDGTVFDTSIEEVAQEAGIYNADRDYTAGLEFTAGAGQMIQGFDEAVIGMKLGESKTVEIPAEKAYGERKDEYIMTATKEEVGEIEGAEVGMQVSLGYYPAKIIEITDDSYTFDLNHELAGETLVFDITIKNIQKAK